MKTIKFILVLFLVVACNQQTQNSPETDSYIAKIKTTQEKDGFQKLYKKGKLIAIGHIAQGKKNGFWKFYRAGKLYAEGHLDQDVKSGFWKTYYPNGQVKTEGHYDNGVQYGYWKYYKADGTAQEKQY